MNQIFLIAISGGPCAGKSSALPLVKKALENEGFLTFIIQEAATELMKSGATYHVCNNAVGFQTQVFNLQIFREELFKEIAKHSTCATSKTIILCDRGAVDCLSYLTNEEVEQFLKLNNVTYTQLINRYDAVFHMTSIATGNPNAYSSESNTVRFESTEEAILSDQKLLNLWQKHHNCYIINYESEFTTKVSQLVYSIKQYVNM